MKNLEKEAQYFNFACIKIASRTLQKGFKMDDLTDFLIQNNVQIIGNTSNTSKFAIAMKSLQSSKNTHELSSVFSAIIDNKFWTYSKPDIEIQRLINITSATLSRDKLEYKISFNELHPKIQKVSSDLYRDGHYAQAILEAFKEFINHVKEKSNVNDRDGAQLMDYVFSVNNPIIKLNNLQTNSERDEQIGFLFLCKGAVLGIRNPKAHENIHQYDPILTLKYLSFASLLIEIIGD